LLTLRAATAASICALTAAMLKLAPICIGGKSMKLCAACPVLSHQHEAPELVDEPVVVGDRAVVLAVEHPRPLEGIQPEVGQDRPVDLDRVAEPAGRVDTRPAPAAGPPTPTVGS
jgi:hypothetical protein